MAKDLVRTRRYVRKFIAMRANVQGVALRVQTLKSNSAMASAMRGVTRAMATMNRQVSATWVTWGVTRALATMNREGSAPGVTWGVTRAMATMNRQLKLPQIQRILLEFQKQSELMDMKEELMNDAIDDALGDEDDEDESDAVVSQVLDELGLNLTDELASEWGRGDF
ncbi:PREDICTED: charged multivesicular body protein 2a [Corvus brachyrhynchos]|uniref:charged multivesicular body protein 2a n=1 Tax=Corvus brachyrhynchos TaxID=85066 RepID=UPI0008165C57|nr:PREDICTED: charged multivesicular body protein 2a [Corvus brachyrhynchos]